MKNKFSGRGFLLALGEGVYILLVAFLMQNANKLFGNKPNTVSLAAFLLLFVVSAVVSGALVFGKPILLYLNGKKKEALELFGFTIAWLSVFLAVFLLFLAIVS
jgi:sterol desaturase/sphingolipid hydroxylase (fatty acid hydroxylase superfamily)